MKYSLLTKAVFLFLTAVLCLSGWILPVNRSAADDCGGKELFRAGKQALDDGRYDDAVKSLSQALDEFPVLADYTLSYLAEAYHQLGDHCKSLDAARRLIGKYPASPLLKKARGVEIREAGEISEKDLPGLYESYLKDYPGDEDITLEYGLYLKGHHEPEKAAALFKKLYLRAGCLAEKAYEELDPESIKPEDLLQRATRLIDRYEFAAAERELRKALAMDCGKQREEIMRNLAYSLFRQKKYEKAAEVYGSVRDLFSRARSLYRAGDDERFEKALKKLLAADDGRAASLLLALASDKRRDGKFDEALKTYKEVLERFPSEEEDALWGMGWTDFIKGEHRKAADIFSKLYGKYDEPRYLYWEARSRDESGGDAEGLFRKLASMDDNFYGVLAYMRGGGPDIVPASLKDESLPAPADGATRFERVEALLSLNMNKEAVTELSDRLNKIDTFPELLYVMSKFQELGEFRRSIGLATKVPYPDKVQMFLYPFAFREDVEEAAKKYDMDPMITLSVMREESRFNADARSVAGARGLMQIMPGTAHRLDRNLKLGIRDDAQITDAKINITLGTYYLKSLFNEFESFSHVFAAYNAGEITVRKWQQKGNYKSVDVFIEDIPYPETRNYVKRVITSYFQYKKAAAARSGKKKVDIIWENL
ncbi:MAG: transglycosylase SLT domain-containing protein [Candidatus Sulfobium sp.]|jgi:soluble lytic murein transglycosylase